MRLQPIVHHPGPLEKVCYRYLKLANRTCGNAPIILDGDRFAFKLRKVCLPILPTACAVWENSIWGSHSPGIIIKWLDSEISYLGLCIIHASSRQYIINFTSVKSYQVTLTS